MPDDQTTTPPPLTVPKEAFEEERNKAKNFRERVTALEAELAPLREKAGQVDVLAGKLAEAEQWQVKAGAASESLDLARLGLLDDEAVAVARALHAARGADVPLTDWVRGLKAEGASVPAPLAVYWQTAAPQQQRPAGAPAGSSPPAGATYTVKEAYAQLGGGNAKPHADAMAEAKAALARTFGVR